MKKISLPAMLFMAIVNSAAVQADPVDVELVLAVDVSLSMSSSELEIQRSGYAKALTDESVMAAIAGGLHGRIAITYFEWAGTTVQQVVVPWTIIAKREDAEMVAARLMLGAPNSARRTSISAALEYGAGLLAQSPFESPRQVIDVSGDGPNNQGAPVEGVRDQLIGQGITINGLPLMTGGDMGSPYDIDDLNIYFLRCVIGGPRAFVVPVTSWDQFPEAVRRKLVLELASSGAPVATPAQWTKSASPPDLMQMADGYDCMIGEKMWRNRSMQWEQR
jgi:hypothetical protein